MQRARTSGRTGARVLAALAMLSVMACAEYRNASGPILPPPPPDNPQLTKASFVFYVNSRNGAIKIESPQGVVSPNPSIRASIVGPDYSLIAGDAITLTASNFTASTVGQFTPGKVRVRFDLSITNILSNVELRTPTFPAPPPGVSGVLMFPFATHVTVTSGGVSVGGSGDSVIVELPNTGQVAPSTDWDGDGSAGSGAPFNFFNDTGCPAGSNDCYRYEAFAAPIASGATTLSRTVGFDIDPTVSNFSAKIIVAADLHNSGPAPTGTVAGAVTSPQLGALSGVLVTVNTGGFTGTTASGTGAYSIANVTTGPKTVTLSGLPGGCTDPGPQSTTVNASATSTVNFSVTCPVPSGTVSGTITRTGPASPSLSGTIITATPAASGTSPANTTLGGSLSYSISGVQIGSGAGAGSGAVAVSNLPAGCTTAPGSYSGLVLGGTATVNFTIDCQAPPAFYQYTALWGTPTGGQVTLTLSFDPSTLNDPAVNGGSPDDFNTFQATLSYSPTRLGFASCANGTGSSFTNITANGATAGSISLLNFKTGAGSTTSQVVAVCTFNVLTGSPASVTTSTSLEVISSFNGDNLIPKTQKNEGTLSLP